MNQPIVGFVFGRKGLMAGATVEGAEIGTSKKWRVIQITARSRGKA